MTATTVSATLTTAAGSEPAATFHVTWTVGGPSGALAEVTGHSNGQKIAGSTYAP